MKPGDQFLLPVTFDGFTTLYEPGVDAAWVLLNGQNLHCIGPGEVAALVPADRIRQLEDENKRLRAALFPFWDVLGENDGDEPNSLSAVVYVGRTSAYGLTLGDFRRVNTLMNEVADDETW